MKFEYKKLKKARKEITTQYKIAEIIDITENYYAKIENGYNYPSVPVFLRICKAVHKPAQYFFNSKETFLSTEQINALMNHDVRYLKAILHILKSLYEETNQ